MKIPDFLKARSVMHHTTDTYPIGETGFSFTSSQRPASMFTPWLAGEGIPDAARKILENHERFNGITVLLRVPTESDVFGEVRAEWILGRSLSGLISMVVRDGGTCEPNPFLDDMAFATTEAERYCASSVIILVQENGPRDSPVCRAALQKAYETGSIQPDMLYPYRVSTKVPVWFASLSSTVR